MRCEHCQAGVPRVDSRWAHLVGSSIRYCQELPPSRGGGRDAARAAEITSLRAVNALLVAALEEAGGSRTQAIADRRTAALAAAKEKPA